jgi:hypothetical protein
MKCINALFVLFFALLYGCSGTLYTYINKDDACVKANGVCTNKYEGILYRPLVLQEDTYIQDKILNSKGEVTHFAGGDGEKKCIPTRVKEQKLVPDLTREYIVQYDSAFFETSEFSIDLNANGTLSKVGTTSTPGGKALVESLTSLATSARTFTHAYQPADLDAVAGVSAAPFCSHGKITISE